MAEANVDFNHKPGSADGEREKLRLQQGWQMMRREAARLAVREGMFASVEEALRTPAALQP